MKLGLYIVATLIFISIIAGFTYYINPSDFTVELLDSTFTYPVFVWVSLPISLLLIFTVAHMLFYGLKNYFIVKRWRADAKSLEDAFYWSIVNEPKEHNFALEELANSAQILNTTSINVSSEVEGLSSRLQNVIEIISKIKAGEYVDLELHKMSKVFNAGNPLLIQNRLNGLSSDKNLLDNVMNRPFDYSVPVQNQALEVFAQTSNFESSKKYVKQFNTTSFLTMLNRVTQEEQLALTTDILKLFIDELTFECKDYMNIAVVAKSVLTPDETLKLFDYVQSKDENAKNAYLYLMFEYELLDHVEEYLENQDEDLFMKFRILYKIKKENTVFNLEDIIDLNSVC